MASDLVLNLNDTTFDAEIAKATVPVIVDFWAPWCGPCRMIGPVIDQIAAEKAGSVVVAKVNVDDCPELSAKFSVRSIPMILFIKDGQVKDSVLGAQSKEALLAKLQAIA
jgi:thioredoxin 1